MKTNKIMKFGVIAMLVGLSSCMRSQNVAYDVDDTYGADESKPYVNKIPAPLPPNSQNQNPDYVESERYANDGEEYYDEEGTRLSSRNLNRSNSNRPGYYNGYDDGYNSASRNWGWGNSFYNYAPSFGFNQFAYSPFGGSMFMSPFRSPYSSFGYGFGNSFGYDPFYGGSMYGFNSPFNSFYSPYGMNSFYDPYGFYGYNSYYSNQFRNPYFGNSYSPYAGYQPVLANNSTNIPQRNRSDRYGDGGRSGGRSNGTYNDGFQNTPNTARDASRRSVESTPANGDYGRSTSTQRGIYENNRAGNGSSEPYYAAPRRGGTSVPSSESSSQRQPTGNSTTEGQTRNSEYSRPSTSNRQTQQYSGGNSEYSRPSRSSRTESNTGSSNSGSTNSNDYNRSRTETYRPAPSQERTTDYSGGSSGSSRSSGSSNSGSSSWGGSSSSGSSSSGSSSSGSSSGGGDGGARSRGPR